MDWWAKVFALKDDNTLRYPVFGKLVKALLSIFSGPLIEGTFNIMDDIVEKDRATMTIANYEGMARVKFGLKKRGQKGTEIKPDPSMSKCFHRAYQVYKEEKKRKKKENRKRLQTK